MTDPDADELSYSGELSFAWQAWREPPTPQLLDQLNADNERTLRMLALLEDNSPSAAEDAAGSDTARLEFKINLILELIGGWLAQQRCLPAPVPARLSPQMLAWTPADAPPACDERGQVLLYLHCALPQPLKLPARICATAEGVAARFEHLSELLVELLRRAVFRYHRRQVARSRPLRDTP